MCSEIIHNGNLISTQKELSEIFPVSTFVYQKSTSDGIEYQENNCLCGIDLFKTARKNNTRVIWDYNFFYIGERECNNAISDCIKEQERLGMAWKNVKFWEDSMEVKEYKDCTMLVKIFRMRHLICVPFTAFSLWKTGSFSPNQSWNISKGIAQAKMHKFADNY